MRTDNDQDRGMRSDITVGVDGTSTALRAVEWAVAEARLRSVALQILHAAPYADGSDQDLGRQRAEAILARAYTVARGTSTEQPLPALLDTSSRIGLLVVGMGGRGRAGDMLIGSTALLISGQARCPVVVARGRRHPRDTDRPVLVGVDEVTTGGPALNFAFADARRHGGRIVVLHARHGVGRLGDRLSGTEPAGRLVDLTYLAHALTPWTETCPDVPIKIDIVVGHPSTALLGAAAHARLLVVGSRSRSAPSRALFGSTSRELLRRSPTPIVVLPTGVTPDPLSDVVASEPAVIAGTDIEHPHGRV